MIKLKDNTSLLNLITTQVSAVIIKLLEEQEISRLVLSELSGVNEKYIGKIEREECSTSAFILKKISLGLNIQL